MGGEMTNNIVNSYVLPHLANIATYEPAEPLESMAKRAGIPVEQIVRLNANENLPGTTVKIFFSNSIILYK